VDKENKIDAISLLVANKTDSELLAAIVSALSDAKYGLIDKLIDKANYDSRSITNVHIVAAIVAAVRMRGEVGAQ